MRIDQALRSDGSESVRVQGFLVGYTGEPLRLCAELLESLPPQCGGPSLIVAGLDVASLPGIARNGDCLWSPNPVELVGVVADGVLRVA